MSTAQSQINVRAAVSEPLVTLQPPSLMRTVLNTHVEAYRTLFALGAVHALLGAVVWLLHAVQWIDNPIQIHPLMMSGGFLMSFAAGFLWTAMPRFTQSPMPRLIELLPLVAFNLASIGAEVVMSERWTLCFLAAMAVWTDVFAVTRFRKRRQEAPESFIFVGIALLLGTLSILTLFVAQWTSLPTTLVLFARSFYLKGSIMFLVMGVGFRLIPAILGIHRPLKMQVMSAEQILLQQKPRHHYLSIEHLSLALVLLSAFVLESLFYTRLAALCFSAATVWSGVMVFHVERLPQKGDRFAWMIWSSVVCLMTAPLLILIWPEQAVHLWHLAFIGGFGLMTIMVSMRVSVSHSGQAQAHVEEKKSFIAWMGWSMLIAALTRMSVAFWPQTQYSHYIYASTLWIIMLALWFRYVLSYSIRAERTKWSLLRAQHQSDHHGEDPIHSHNNAARIH